MSDLRVVVAVMTRAPSAADGKTRLLRSLESRDAERFRQALLLDTLDAVASVGGVTRAILFTPQSASDEIARLAPASVLAVGQRGKDLGERMHFGFVDLFAAGFDAVVIVGSDLPDLPPAHVECAVATLADEPDPLVIGPSADGGYYLIGLRRAHGELFRDIHWSTPTVFDETLLSATRHRLSIRQVPPWHDVDSKTDLERLAASMPDELSRTSARRTRCWLADALSVRAKPL